MLQSNTYFFIVLNISAGLLTLLGAVGIFVSLVIQRRVERLQDILEELMDLSYIDGKNITTKIQNLIYKYQMQYMLPAKPIKTVLAYINITIVFVLLLWGWLLFLTYRPPFQYESLIFLLPMVCVSAVMIFYRQLIKNTINPVNNNLFNSIIPSPRYLRSITFLSGHVNVSVFTIIQQARPAPVLRKQDSTAWKVFLKEELPFDDYHYYFSIRKGNTIYFVSCGHLIIELDDDPITGKPQPIARNLNIPLGTITHLLEQSELQARFLIFPKGEKHPLEFNYTLRFENQVYYSSEAPSNSVNYMITYKFQSNNTLTILNINSDVNKALLMPPQLKADGFRRYYNTEKKQFVIIKEKPYID